MGCNRVSIAVLLAVSAVTINYSSADNSWGTDTPSNGLYCPDLKPQPLLDLDQIMQKWYVAEVMEHKLDPIRLPSSGHFVVETCPTVILSSTGRSNLRLLWSTEAGNLDYSFNIPDLLRSPGYWVSKGLQNGTLLNKDYIHFVGVVQVMKAVASHMVLTFCSRTPDNQLYSILLSRERKLPESDTIGVRDLLSRRGLALVSIKETCLDAGSGKDRSYVTRWTTFIIGTSVIAVLAFSYMTTIHVTTTTSF